MSFTADSLERYLQIATVLLVVLAVLAVVLLIVRRDKISGKRSKGVNILYSILSIVLLIVIIASNVATSIFASSINSVFTKASNGDPTVTTTMDDWRGLVTDIADEGMVLIKNENKILPLEQGTKINLLGYAAYNPFFSGSGSGSVSAADSVTVEKALTDAGFEVNPAPGVATDMWPEKPADTNPYGYNDGDLFFGEPSINNYTGDISFENLKAYSDTAVVVIGRSGGEGYDLTALTDADYLQLTENEKDLLEAATKQFDKVIVILNMANAIQLDELSKYDIDAMVWTGLPGPYGFASLGRIMNGTVNPSGSLPDTWIYDNDSNPAMENFGDQPASNGSYYVDYVEGIYVGYKWYETAYAERAVITNTKTGETFDYNNYDQIVAYPFGYGLSYTTFEQEISNAPTSMDPQGTLSFEVTVKNTGDVSGKDAVQLYLSAPYTDYDKTNGVEKAAVSLCAIAKTGEIAPGASETVSLEVNVEDIASYDSSYVNADGSKGAYMLDAGDYEFILGDNAHVAYDSAKVSLSADYFYTGNDKRASDVEVAVNEFEDAARGEYLSRQDGFANYASAMASVSDKVESTDWEDNTNQYDASYDEVVVEAYVKGTDYAANGSMTLEDVAGLDYEDPAWDELISQLTVEEMQALVTDATYKTPSVESVGRGATTDSDGPLGISSMFNSDLNSVAYPCIPILSATFNVDLAKRFGELVSDQAHNKGVTGWYAPAMDTHRTAYSGRNYEYYSEDAWLGAEMAAAAVAGARDRGMIVYIKHFALNDQETHRAESLHTYSNEQAIREIYLKPFEYAVKEGGANAVMTSMNYIGDVYAGGCEGLLQGVLRGEWGFRGKSLTDMDEANEGVNVDKCMRAGTDCWLSIFGVNMKSDVNDADIYYLQRTAKNILFADANSRIYEAQIVNWRAYLFTICGALAVLIVVMLAAMVMRNKKEA